MAKVQFWGIGLACVSILWVGAAHPEALDAQKKESVRPAVVKLIPPDKVAEKLEAAHRADAIVDIKAARLPGGPAVVIRTSGKPAPRVSTIDEGIKIVMDFYNTVNLRDGRNVVPNDASLVRQVRTSLYQIEPEYVSRVVLDLTRACPYHVEQNDDTVTICVTGPAVPSAPAPPVVAEEPAKEEGPLTPLEALSLEQQKKAALAQLGRALEDAARPTAANPQAVRQETAAPRELALAEAHATGAALSPECTDDGSSPAEPAPNAARMVAESLMPERSGADSKPIEVAHVEAAKAEVSEAEVTEAKITEAAAVAHEPSSIAAMAAVNEPPAEAADNSANEPEKAQAENPGTVPESQPNGSEPPPPPARTTPVKGGNQAEGGNVLTRMKQVLTGIAGMAKNPALEGLLTSGAAQPAGNSPAAAAQPGGEPPKPGKAEKVKAGSTGAIALAADGKENAEPAFVGNPLDQVVNLDFRQTELSNIVAILAMKAGINVIAGADLTGPVTVSLKNVTLRKAMDTVLRMNGLGMVEEEGVYYIVPYEEALAAKRVTVLVKLENGNVADIRKTLDEVVKGSPPDMTATLSANETTNTLIISGAETRVQELKRLAMELDTTKAVTPTVTEAIKVNNGSPKDLQDLVKGMLTPKLGKVAIDERSRHVVVTDVPIVLEQVRALLKQVDLPVKQVSIDAMIVDAVLDSDSQTGVDWITNSVRKINKRGKTVGSLTGLTNQVDATGVQVSPGVLTPIGLTQRLTMGMLADGIDFKAVVAAEVTAQKGKLLANPVIVTVENQKAMINISQEIPYQESQQSTTGPPMTSTAFKDIGITLEVTPKVTHDDHVIAQIHAKQSEQNGEFNNIPIEDKRETDTTLRTRNGQTIFIGGLRRLLDNSQSKRVPVLGDIPIINILFRSNTITKESTELLVFLTCNVLPDDIENLPPDLQKAHDEIETVSRQPHAEKRLGYEIVHPNEGEDPAWKWRRSR